MRSNGNVKVTELNPTPTPPHPPVNSLPGLNLLLHLSVCTNVVVVVGVCSRFESLSTCIRPYLTSQRCTSHTDRQDDQPLSSAARRLALSRRLRDWSSLVHQLTAICGDSRQPGTSANRQTMLWVVTSIVPWSRAFCIQSDSFGLLY